MFSLRKTEYCLNFKPIRTMKEALLLNSCDPWHSHDSMELLGIFTNSGSLRHFLTMMKWDRKISQENIDELLEHHQTQGLDTNYFIQTKYLNPAYDNH